MKIKITSISGRLPSYETSGAAGMDIRAFLKEPVTLLPGKRALIPTGLFMEIPAGYEAQIRARSGLAIKNSIACSVALGQLVGLLDGDNDVVVFISDQRRIHVCAPLPDGVF